MSSESETSDSAEAECKRSVTIFEQVMNAIKALGSRNGSSRDEIVDFLVSRDLMQAKIAKALVSKALYKALDDGLVKRPKGSKLYQIKTSRRSRRGQRHAPRKSAHDGKRRKAERRKDGKRKHRCHKSH